MPIRGLETEAEFEAEDDVVHRTSSMSSASQRSAAAAPGIRTMRRCVQHANVLMVTEKPSIARALVSALSRDGNVRKSFGASRMAPIYEFGGEFHGIPARIRVTSVLGHVYRLDFPKPLRNWQNIDPRALFESKPVVEETRPKTRIVAHLRQEAKTAHALVLWLDCDREGENICYEVISAAEPHMLSPKLILRAHFSSLNPCDLWRAYETLGLPDRRLSDAVQTRMEIDLKLGVAFSRFLTLFVDTHFPHVLPMLGMRLISYGPCQVPALWFVVKRFEEMEMFLPVPYWDVAADINGYCTDGSRTVIRFERVGGCFWKHEEAVNCEKSVQNEGVATTVSVETNTTYRKRPLPLNTVCMLQTASSGLHMGANKALTVAESLYIAGLITYPRTETTCHAESFDPKDIASELFRAQGHLGKTAIQLCREGVNMPRKDGHDAGDHPPIIPVRMPDEGDNLDQDQCQLFNLVVSKFLQSISTDASSEEICATIQVGGEKFTSTASKIIDPGWMSVESEAELEIDATQEFEHRAVLLTLRAGQSLKVSNVRLTANKTSSPKPLTESDLLGFMEKFRIGTDATMASHVTTIIDRGYAKLEEETRSIEPTAFGRALVHGLSCIDEDLCSPVVRASIEAGVSAVASGRTPSWQVVQKTIKLFTLKYDSFTPKAHMVLLMLAAATACVETNDVPIESGDHWFKAISRMAAVSIDRLLFTINDEAQALEEQAMQRTFFKQEVVEWIPKPQSHTSDDLEEATIEDVRTALKTAGFDEEWESRAKAITTVGTDAEKESWWQDESGFVDDGYHPDHEGKEAPWDWEDDPKHWQDTDGNDGNLHEENWEDNLVEEEWQDEEKNWKSNPAVPAVVEPPNKTGQKVASNHDWSLPSESWKEQKVRLPWEKRSSEEGTNIILINDLVAEEAQGVQDSVEDVEESLKKSQKRRQRKRHLKARKETGSDEWEDAEGMMDESGDVINDSKFSHQTVKKMNRPSQLRSSRPPDKFSDKGEKMKETIEDLTENRVPRRYFYEGTFARMKKKMDEKKLPPPETGKERWKRVIAESNQNLNLAQRFFKESAAPMDSNFDDDGEDYAPEEDADNLGYYHDDEGNLGHFGVNPRAYRRVDEWYAPNSKWRGAHHPQDDDLDDVDMNYDSDQITDAYTDDDPYSARYDEASSPQMVWRQVQHGFPPMRIKQPGGSSQPNRWAHRRPETTRYVINKFR